MSSLTNLQDALLQLEDHLCRAGTALVQAEQDTEAADVQRMCARLAGVTKQQVEFLRDYAAAVQELGSNAPEA